MGRGRGNSKRGTRGAILVSKDEENGKRHKYDRDSVRRARERSRSHAPRRVEPHASGALHARHHAAKISAARTPTFESAHYSRATLCFLRTGTSRRGHCPARSPDCFRPRIARPMRLRGSARFQTRRAPGPCTPVLPTRPPCAPHLSTPDALYCHATHGLAPPRAHSGYSYAARSRATLHIAPLRCSRSAYPSIRRGERVYPRIAARSGLDRWALQPGARI